MIMIINDAEKTSAQLAAFIQELDQATGFVLFLMTL